MSLGGLVFRAAHRLRSVGAAALGFAKAEGAWQSAVKTAVCLSLFGFVGLLARVPVRAPPIGIVTPLAAAVDAGSADAAGAAPALSSSSPSASQATSAAEGPVYLNVATVQDLQRLPGIGPRKAEAIVEERARVGRFRGIEGLLKVKGIGRGTLKRLRPRLALDPPDGGS